MGKRNEMKPEIENEEIANTGAACKRFPSLRTFECSHCRFSTLASQTLPEQMCPNQNSAWSQEVLTYADGSRIPIIVDAYRCYCQQCLASRSSSTRSLEFSLAVGTDGCDADAGLNAKRLCEYCKRWRTRLQNPISYRGWKRRCRICGAVDGIPYAKFIKSLHASRSTEDCEIFKDLCNRGVCKRNRRFQIEIPDISWAHDKQSYPAGYAGEDVPVPKSLFKWSSHPTSKANNKACKARYGRKILGAGAPVEGTTWFFWTQAKDPDFLFEQHTESELDFGEIPMGQQFDRRLESYKTATGEWKSRVRDVETFDVTNIKGVTGIRNLYDPSICDFGINNVEWSRLETKHIRDKYAEYQSLLDLRLPSLGCKIKKVNQTPWFIVNGFAPEIEASEAKQWDEEYRRQHTDETSRDYLPKPEISPDRQIETSRETTRGGYTDETVVIKSISEDEKWRKAVLLKFGKKPVDFNFTNGLYMLVDRPQQPPRVYLLIDAKDFQAPDERVYIGIDQFKTARAAMAKSTGFAIQSLLKCPSRVLTFEQNGAEIRVTVSDCEMFEDENMGKKMSRAKQLEFVQQLTGE